MKSLLAAAVGLVMLLSVAVAGAHEIDIHPTEIDNLDAAVADGAVTVSGEVLFGGQGPQDLGSDPAGDNTGGAATAPLGVDLTGAQISWPDPEKDELLFEILVDQLPPTLAGTPEAVQYNWDIAVDGGADRGGANWSIKVMRTSLYRTQGTEAYGALYRCVPSDTGFSCSEEVRLAEVEFLDDEGIVRAGISLVDLGARRGSTIAEWHRTGSGPVWAAPSLSGILTTGQRYDAIPAHTAYQVPTGKSVQVGIAPAGEDLDFTTAATLAPDDTFTGSLAAPEPGTYDVGARACFADNCATESVEVEVSP